jgi:hypothetical protein
MVFFCLGPKLYKRLTGKTNKSTIINSLNQLVLAGVVNANIRKQVIEVIPKTNYMSYENPTGVKSWRGKTFLNLYCLVQKKNRQLLKACHFRKDE